MLLAAGLQRFVKVVNITYSYMRPYKNINLSYMQVPLMSTMSISGQGLFKKICFVFGYLPRGPSTAGALSAVVGESVLCLGLTRTQQKWERHRERIQGVR